ncbi:MAG: Peptide methionine sulfoxide reductase MsrA [bacterium ADurb.Bin400]|nr:MAG: Peptide methionine sulfoxide reductase MsrA [bacterium ADurb.Bin400]
MKDHEVAVFGGGCFWCVEAIFQNLRGVTSVTPGYAGGFTENPTYAQVSTGETGHAEVARIEFDPGAIFYEDLLEVFFELHNPTTKNRQGADIGSQYRSIVLYTNEDQREKAEKYIHKLERDKIYASPIVTEIKKLDNFYSAENYHQNYYEAHKDAPYCQFIISPKLKKLRQKFAKLVKDQ